MDDFAPGFRITRRDQIVLAIGVLATGALAPFNGLAAYVTASAVGHFFLFCNVFRLPRALELFWASGFVLAMLAYMQGVFPFITSVTAHETLAILCIAASTKLPSYHGIFWQRWNPKLREWWESQR